MNSAQLSTQKVLVHDLEKCAGCMLCMIICSFEHYGVFDFEKAFIKVLEDVKRKFIIVSCTHCEHPICEFVCPSGAIFKDRETGIVRINSMKCIGCKNCIVMCPISAPRFDHEHMITVKCDLCSGDPKCAKFCLNGALKFVPREEARKNGS